MNKNINVSFNETNKITVKHDRKKIIVSSPVSLKNSQNSNNNSSKASLPSELDYSNSHLSSSSNISEIKPMNSNHELKQYLSPMQNGKKNIIKLPALPKGPKTNSPKKENINFEPIKETTISNEQISPKKNIPLSHRKKNLIKKSSLDYIEGTPSQEKEKAKGSMQITFTKEYEDYYKNSKKDAFQRIFENIKEKKQMGINEEGVTAEMLHDGKVIICKKNDIIIRNNVAVKLISPKKKSEVP